MHPGYVERTQALLAARPEVVLCHSEAQPILTSGDPVGAAYVGWTNEAPTVGERWRTILRHSELHAAIYGLMRAPVARRTRGLLACVGADWIFMIEMSVLGSIAQVPETLQYKRVPGEADAYHTREEMLSYLGARSTNWRAQLRPVRADVTRQAVRALPALGVPRANRVRMLADAVRIYAAEGGCRVDARDIAAVALARGRRRCARADG
jgi:hypothetical protein